jgi:hypothetical protein
MGAIIQYKQCSHAIQHAMGQIGGKFSHFSLVSDKIISDIFD